MANVEHTALKFEGFFWGGELFVFFPLQCQKPVDSNVFVSQRVYWKEALKMGNGNCSFSHSLTSAPHFTMWNKKWARVSQEREEHGGKKNQRLG